MEDMDMDWDEDVPPKFEAVQRKSKFPKLYLNGTDCYLDHCPLSVSYRCYMWVVHEQHSSTGATHTYTQHSSMRINP
eukprot:3075438-Amphidinium_carterae.1